MCSKCKRIERSCDLELFTKNPQYKHTFTKDKQTFFFFQVMGSFVFVFEVLHTLSFFLYSDKEIPPYILGKRHPRLVKRMFCWTQLFFLVYKKQLDLTWNQKLLVDSKLCSRLHFERFTTSAIACMLIRIFCKAPNGTSQIFPGDISMLVIFPISHQQLKQQTFYCTVWPCAYGWLLF